MEVAISSLPLIGSDALRKRVETILQKGLGSMLVFNDQGVDAEPD